MAQSAELLKTEQHYSRIKRAVDSMRALQFLWRGSKALRGGLERARLQPVPQAVLDAYQSSKSVIEAVFGSDHVRRGLLHHGTGALQYAGDKYGAGMTGQLRRPLDTILEDNLKPHTDPWLLTQGSMQSTSFATVWSYAKFYADAHQAPDDPLQWEYGDGTEWFSYCIVDTGRQEFKRGRTAGKIRTWGQSKGSLLQTLRTRRQLPERNTPANYNRLQRWARDIRSDITPQTSTLDVLSGRTNIPGNFSAIITVSEDDVPLAPMEFGGTYEKRAAHTIEPSLFTSLAVPLNRVEEYNAKARGLGYSFPVLSIEAIEYHMSRFPVEELAHAQRIA